MMQRLGVVIATLCLLAACSAPAPGQTGTDAAGAPAGQAAETAEPADDSALVPVQAQQTQTRQGRETVRTAEASIDWDAARNDLAARGRSADGQAFQIESGPDAPPVPVLLPSGLVRTASAERPRFVTMADGYYAKYPGTGFDIIVSGTNEWYSGGTAGRESPAGEAVFTRTMTGAQVALNRYGAAYLVEFECLDAEGADPSGCISETEALDIARGLQITGTR